MFFFWIIIYFFSFLCRNSNSSYLLGQSMDSQVFAFLIKVPFSQSIGGLVERAARTLWEKKSPTQPLLYLDRHFLALWNSFNSEKIIAVIYATYSSCEKKAWKKNELYLSVNIFSTKVLIGDTIFYVSYWRRDCHFTWSSEPREGLAVCSERKYLHSLVTFRPRVLVRSRESNPRPHVLQSSALPIELFLQRLNNKSENSSIMLLEDEIVPSAVRSGPRNDEKYLSRH